MANKLLVQIRNHNGMWEKRVPQSRHPQWRAWQPIPCATIGDYLNRLGYNDTIVANAKPDQVFDLEVD